MSTEQNYAAGSFNAIPFEPVATEPVQPTFTAADKQPVPAGLLTVDAFIRQHSALRGLAPADLAPLLSEQLRLTPVHYENILDGVALLRAFIPAPTEYVPTHYALLLQDWAIMGLLHLPANEGERYDTGLFIAYTSETRPLISGLLSTEADKVLLATTRVDDDYCLSEGGMRWVENLFWALHTFDVDMIDYLLLYPDANVSRAWEAFGEDGMDEGVDINVFYEYALPNGSISDPLSA